MGGYRFKKRVMALGAESKGVYALGSRSGLYTSRDFGSLFDYRNFSGFRRSAVRRMKRFRPGIVACDMHPAYNTTELAEETLPPGAKLVKAQHHHAHIVSCMFDNDLKGRVIGVALDGTGYGTDGNVWGGEFMIATYRNFRRAGHLKYLPMPGADKAVTEPWRMGAVYLRDAYGDKFLKLDIPFVKNMKKTQWHDLRRAADKRINSPLTSSMGRLFDAVSAILLSFYKVSFEAEAAIQLQKRAEDAYNENRRYSVRVNRAKGVFIIDPKETIKGIVKDIRRGLGHSVIAAKFHNSAVEMVLSVCMALRRETGINSVALTGGVFQNIFLLEKALAHLNNLGFDVYANSASPASDAGIPVGQAVIADARS